MPSAPIFPRVALWAALILAAAPLRASPPPVVVSDIAPIHSLVARVMQGVGAPKLLIPRAGLADSFVPGREERRLLADAALVFLVGRQLTPGLARPFAKLSRKVWFVELAEVPGLPLPHSESLGAPIDPHLWLNPAVAQLWLPVIADALSEIDPGSSMRYRENAATAAEELAGLEAAVAARMRALGGRSYAVPDLSLSHFEAAFALKRAGQVDLAANAGPGPISELGSAGVVCIFLRPGDMSPGLAEHLAAADLAVAVFDVMGDGVELGPGLYPALIDKLALSFERCLAPAPAPAPAPASVAE